MNASTNVIGGSNSSNFFSGRILDGLPVKSSGKALGVASINAAEGKPLGEDIRTEGIEFELVAIALDTVLDAP